jgi:hypothetical protein
MPRPRLAEIAAPVAAVSTAPGADAAERPGDSAAPVAPARERDLADRNVETGAFYRALDAARAAAPEDRVWTMVAAVNAYADAIWAAVRPELETPGAPIACAAGCAACCHQQVAITPAEAVAIARHVDCRFSPAERAALVARLKALDGAVRGLDAPARARLKRPCAFLVDGRCSIYDARPLRCRGVYSRDAAHCRWAMDHPDAAAERRRRAGPGPYIGVSARIMDASLTGLARACREMTLEVDSLELTVAARIALAVPDIELHYRSGEPVFAAAALPEPEAAAAPAQVPAA